VPPTKGKHGKTGFLVESEDSKNFVKYIKELLNNDIRRLEMGKNARKRIEQLFDVKRNARQTEEIYQELLNETRN